MTDPDLVLKKLARIESCLQDLHDLARPEDLTNDLREQRFVEHTLQIAIQSAIDAAAHVVADERLGEPRTQRELFDFLARAGWIEAKAVTPYQNFHHALRPLPSASLRPTTCTPRNGPLGSSKNERMPSEHHTCSSCAM